MTATAKRDAAHLDWSRLFGAGAYVGAATKYFYWTAYNVAHWRISSSLLQLTSSTRH
jgi:hypothetical protein